MTTIPASAASALRMSTSSFIAVPSQPTATTQAGKISVVPTNILLKPQTQQPNIIFQNSPTSILRPQMFQTQTNFISSSTQPQNHINQYHQMNQINQLNNQLNQMNQIQVQGNGNSNMPMKLLLVNRMPQTTTANTEPPKTVQPQPIAPAPKTQRDEVTQQSPASSSKRSKLHEIRKSKHSATKSSPGIFFNNICNFIIK